MLNSLGSTLSSVSSSLSIQNVPHNLKNAGLKIGTYVVPLLALLILESLPKASAGTVSYALCVAKCACFMPPPACTAICLAALPPYCP